MLHFFKKSGQRDKSGLQLTSPNKTVDPGKSTDGFTGCLSSSTQAGTLCSLEEEEEDDIVLDSNDQIYYFRSRLSKTLPEILSNKNALGYFIQFLETRNSISLVKFWLEVENLRHKLTKNGKRINDNEFSCKLSSISESLPLENLSSENGELSLDNNVNSKDFKSNCNVIPKTKQTTSEKNQLALIYERNENISTTPKQDALRIYKKYIAKDALCTTCVPEELKTEIEMTLPNEDIEPTLRCLSIIQNNVLKILEDEYMNDFMRSEFHCKHQIDVLTCENVQLADILHNETSFFYFMEFMELENRRELLDFWMSVMNYKQTLTGKGNQLNSMDAQSDALIIYDKYFSLQATMPLGFSDKIRFQVEQNICREDGKSPQSDCFDKPCKIVYNFLNKHYISPFLSSQLYYKYLSELISTIQSNPSNLHPRVKRAGSDCSSEISSISVNTTNLKSEVNDNMSIDTRQLYDPDSLWKRNKYSLSVGYIDGLGRFVTEIEPDPYRKYESRLTRAVKRLVNIDKDKAKEELAWKIAEMIVREITSLTLGTTATLSSR